MPQLLTINPINKGNLMYGHFSLDLQDGENGRYSTGILCLDLTMKVWGN